MTAGPPTRDAVVVRGLNRHVRRQFKAMGRALRLLRRGDASAAHDVRVATRRLEAALDALRAGGSGEARKAESRALRRGLGKLRELEVLAVTLRTLLEPSDAPARPAGRPLLGRLTRRSARERDRASRRARRGVVALVERWEKVKQGGLPGGIAIRRAALRRADSRRISGMESLDHSLRAGDGDSLHEARLAIKKWRYALEIVAATTGEAPPAVVAGLIALQRSLGTIHDADALRGHLLRRSERWRRDGSGERAAALMPLLRRLGVLRRRELRRLGVLARAGVYSSAARSSAGS